MRATYKCRTRRGMEVGGAADAGRGLGGGREVRVDWVRCAWVLGEGLDLGRGLHVTKSRLALSRRVAARPLHRAEHATWQSRKNKEIKGKHPKKKITWIS
jgi:hypothetical protein